MSATASASWLARRCGRMTTVTWSCCCRQAFLARPLRRWDSHDTTVRWLTSSVSRRQFAALQEHEEQVEHAEHLDVPAPSAPSLLTNTDSINDKPTLKDLWKIKPRIRSEESIRHMSLDGQMRYRQKVWTTALKSIQSSFTVAQLRSMAVEANLKGPKSTLKKAEIAQRIVKEVWKIQDPEEAKAAHAREEAEVSDSEIEIDLSWLEGALFRMHSSAQKEIEGKYRVSMRLLEAEVTQVQVKGSEQAVTAAAQEVDALCQSLTGTRVILDLSRATKASTATDIPTSVLGAVMVKSLCLALPQSAELSESTTSEDPGEVPLRYELTGRSEAACSHAAALLRSYLLDVAISPTSSAFFSAATVEAVGSDQPVQYHLSPTTIPSAAPWTNSLLLASSFSQGHRNPHNLARPATSPKGNGTDALSHARIVRSRNRVEEMTPVTWERTAKPPSRLWSPSAEGTLSNLFDTQEAETLWPPNAHPEWARGGKYTATFGHLLHSLPEDSAIGFGQSKLLPELVSHLPIQDRVFVPMTPPLMTGQTAQFDSLVVNRWNQLEDLIRLVYVTEDGSRRLIVEFEKQDVEQEQRQGSLSKALNEESQTKSNLMDSLSDVFGTSRQEPRWQLKVAHWEASEVVDVLAPEGSVDVRCTRQWQEEADVDAAWFDNFLQAFGEQEASNARAGVLLPTPSSEERMRRDRPPGTAAPAPTIASPPCVLSATFEDSAGATAAASREGEREEMKLLSYARVLRKTWRLLPDKSISPELDARQFGFIPAELPAGAEVDVVDRVTDDRYERFAVREQIVEPGELHARVETRLEWHPIKSDVEAEGENGAADSASGTSPTSDGPLTWLMMRKALDNWLESKYSNLFEGRGNR